MNPHFDRALAEAQRFRGLGYNPLPSKMTVKGPMMDTFAEFWEHPLPASVFSRWATTNIQIMTGSFWKLAVVDCDGDTAHNVFREIKNHHGFTGPMPTWVAKTGGGGWHYYFSLPDWIDECPSGRLWGIWDTWAGAKHTGDWMNHQEIRLLADRALVVAPPSIHVKTGEPYRWLQGRSPDDIERPMMAPEWLLSLPILSSPKLVEALPSPRVQYAPRGPISSSGGHYDRNLVLASIPDKIALARSWGLRVEGSKANSKGWWTCHAIDRPDATPSASIHEETGIYFEQREARKMPFFDLAVALGQYRTWLEACNDLGARYHAPS